MNAKAGKVSRILNNGGVSAREFQRERVERVLDELPEVGNDD